MQFTQLFDDDRAVSPVIGVILMVAITVILAAVIGTFVLGMSDQMGETSPRASFGFNTNSDGSVAISHESGATLTAANVNVSAGSMNGNWNKFQIAGDAVTEITAGETIVVGDGNGDGSIDTATDLGGETVRVIYSNPDSDSSTTLQKFEVPN